MLSAIPVCFCFVLTESNVILELRCLVGLRIGIVPSSIFGLGTWQFGLAQCLQRVALTHRRR